LSKGATQNCGQVSVAAFYASFKAVTAISPMQYLKTTRLRKATTLTDQNTQGIN